MANVDNGDLVASNPIVNNVGVAPEPKGVHAQPGNKAMTEDRYSEIGNPLFDVGLHLPRRARVAPVDVFKNGLAIGNACGV